MILILFALLSGMVLCLSLSIPYEFCPIPMILFLAAAVLVFIFRKLVKYRSLAHCLILAIPFAVGFLLCTQLIFPGKERASFVSLRPGTISSPMKEAVILYCSGQPKGYSTTYAGSMLKEIPLILKPYHASRIRHMLSNSLHTDTSSLSRIENEIRNSLLHNRPCFFYTAYTQRDPRIEDALQASINDGCSNITIVNYSTDKLSLPQAMTGDLERKGITIRITAPVCMSQSFPEAIAEMVDGISKPDDGIALLTNNNSTVAKNTDSICSLLEQNGYDRSHLLVSDDAEESIDKLTRMNMKQICVVYLANDNTNPLTGFQIRELEKKHAKKIKLQFLSSWSYSKHLSHAAIEATRNRR